MKKSMSLLAPGVFSSFRTASVSTVARPSYHAGRLAFKRGFDATVALSFMVLFIPLILAVIALIIAVQGRPILIRHNRIGRNGRMFPCLKFRTMVTNGDEVLKLHIADNAAARTEWENSRKLKNDPRVTPLGRVLRKTSLDELPQLINVLRGDMSLVGPRPIVSEEARFYGNALEHYHAVRPGLTGAWQVGGRSDVSYASRVQMDVQYVKHWSTRKDLLILLKTVPAVLKSQGSC